MKQQILSQISSKLSALGISVQNGNGADITISTEFLDASWSTGKKKINYEASVFIDEACQTVFMWEKTTETGHGLSFGGDSGTSFQSGKTLFRKVKSIQYAPDGKAYEYTLDLGAIPKNVKETAKQYGFKFNTVLSRSRASYPPGYMHAYTAPKTQMHNTQPHTAIYCTNCGMPLEVGVNFCKNCGMPIENIVQATGIPTEHSPKATMHKNPPQQYSNPQDTFYGQSKQLTPKEGSGKSSALNTIVFWVVWSILTLLCILMLIDELSALRIAGFAIIVALPIFFRKRFFRKFLSSVFSWLITFIAFIIIMTVTGASDKSNQVNTNLTVQSQGNVNVSMLKGVLPEGSSISVLKDKNPPSVEMDEVSYDAYDITLPPGSVIDSVAQIEMPYNKKMVPPGMTPKDVLSAAYFNPGKNAWEPVSYIIDEEKGVVTVLTDHFSKYAVVYFKDGRKKLSTRLPEFDGMSTSLYSDSDLEKIVGELGDGSQKYPSALAAGWNQFGTYYGLTGAAGNILTASIDSKMLNNINDLMTEAGLGFAFAQLALDIYSGDNNAAVNNLIKNATSYSASKWGGSAVNLASAGVAFMDIAINKFAEKAIDKNLQKWEDAYRKYYQTNLKVKRSAVDWYNIVKKLHAESSGPEEFKAKLDASITQYTELFWKDSEGYAYVADSTPGLRGFGAGGEYALGVAEIGKRYKQYIYGTTMKPVMEVFMKNLCLLEYKKSQANFKKLKAEMNKVYTITVNLSNFKEVKNLKGTMVRFKNGKGQVIHSQSFDDSGRAVLKMSLFGFLKAEGPTTIEVRVPAQDNTAEFNTTLTYKLDNTNIMLNAPYVPAVKPEDKPIEKKPADKPAQQEANKPDNTTVKPTEQVPKQEPPKTEQPKQEYNYNAALAAWAADFAAETNKRTYDDGKCKSTFQFEWVKAPIIKDGQVIGASKIWETDVYYAGPRKGETVRWVSNESYSASNPGSYISLTDLKKKYPKFGN